MKSSNLINTIYHKHMQVHQNIVKNIGEDAQEMTQSQSTDFPGIHYNAEITGTNEEKTNTLYETTNAQRTATEQLPRNGQEDKYYGKCPKVSNTLFHTIMT